MIVPRSAVEDEDKMEYCTTLDEYLTSFRSCFGGQKWEHFFEQRVWNASEESSSVVASGSITT
ncbi:MAG: hypothetical protein AYK19_00150 [Theionarchaea archaeon DG-70-1]|nr:MAG: hypothetical protein AYK19_00150 [Theionarchaea archaeon DG-70-1]